MKRIFYTTVFVGLMLVLAVAADFALKGPVSTQTASASAPAGDAGFTSALAPTDTLAWNAIALPLAVDGISAADDVAHTIDANGSIKKVARWHADTGSWEVRAVGDPFSVNFPVETGDPIFVAADSSAPGTASWVGDVPAQGSLQFSLLQNAWNYIMIPLDQDGQFTMTADGLASDIGGVTKVARWHASTNSWEVRAVGDPFSANFSVAIGYPYFVYTSDSTPSVWP